MKYMYTNEPDALCHKIKGVSGRPTNTAEQQGLRAKGWVFDPSQLVKPEVKKEVKKDLSIPEQAKALGIKTEENGKKIHYKLLAKKIEALKNGDIDEG